MAQEEGLVLSSFFEFQAFTMLDYLRIKSAYIESSCKGHHENCPDKYLIYIHRTYGMRIFFSEGNLIGSLCGPCFPISSLRQR